MICIYGREDGSLYLLALSIHVSTSSFVMQPPPVLISYTSAYENNFQPLCSNSRSQFHHLAWNTESVKKKKDKIKNKKSALVKKLENIKQKELLHFQNHEVISWAQCACVWSTIGI